MTSLHPDISTDKQDAFHTEILDSAPDAIVVLDGEANVVFWNLAAEELFGWSPSEIVGQPFTILVPEARRGELLDRMRSANRWRRSHGRSIAAVQAQTRSGETFLLQVHYSRFTRAEQRYLIATLRPRSTVLAGDVDDTNLFIQTMVDSSPDAIICTNANGTVLAWNAAAERIFGYEAEEIIGKSILITLPEERQEEGREILKRVIGGEEIFGYRTVARRKDGTLIDIEPNLWPVYDAGGAILGVACVTHDLTERVALETKLDDAHRIAAVGRLAATVAHEFNNVLMSIGPFVEVIRRKAPADPTIENAARHIAVALHRGKNITGEVLRFGRPSSPNFTTFDAVRWIRRVADELRTLIPSRIRFEVTTPSEPLEITADEHQLTQLVTNLALNARDAVGRQAGEIEICVAALDGRELELTVRDTGAGIPEELRDNIFEPLFTTKPNGTGLGLPVSQQIARRHGGDLSVSSSSAGTVFRVVLPREH